jgi:hypothetical protein
MNIEQAAMTRPPETHSPGARTPLSSRARRVLVGAYDRGVDEIAFVVAFARQRLDKTSDYAQPFLRPARMERTFENTP